MSPRTSIAFAALGLVFSLGCTQILPPLTPPEAGGPAWREVVSQHVILRTDRGEAEAQEALVELEHTFVALHDIAFSQLDISGSRIVVVHFDRERDFQKFAPAATTSRFFGYTPGDQRPEPTMIVWGKLDAAKRTNLQHELTHMFAHTSLGELPVWLDEGLAQYYETLEIEEGFAYIGRPLQTKRAWPQTGFGNERRGVFFTRFVPIGYVPAVPKLVAMDRVAFNVWDDKGRQPTDEEINHRDANFLGAFGLVHMLFQEEKYQAGFDKLMDELTKNVPPERAWQAAFGSVPVDQMETDFRQHLLNRYETMVLRTPYTFPKVETQLAREMAPADVHVMWARLRPWAGEDLAAAEADLEAARKLAPDSSELRLASGRLAFRKGELERAAAELDAALAKRPTDAELLTEALMVLDARLAKGADAALAAARGDLIARLEKAAPTGESLRFLALHAEAQGKPDAALELARRSVQTGPTCGPCFATLGKLLFGARQLDAALRATSTAMSLLPDGKRDLELEAQYRQHLDAVMHAPVAPVAPAPPPQAPPAQSAPAPAPTAPAKP